MATSKHRAKEVSSDDQEDCDACEIMGSVKHVLSGIVSRSAHSQESQQHTEPKKIETVQKHQHQGDSYWEMKEPPDIIELGNSGWTLLHTIAAYYPKNPTEEKKKQVRNFLDSMSLVFPCSYCAKDMQKILIERPPRLDSQDEFAQWMCEAHNEVNKHLGKPEFDCSKVNERWRRQIPPKKKNIQKQ